MSTIVIGDVHGCLEELDELLGVIGAGHRLVFLGDLVDRGPDPVGVVRRVRELGAPCVMGNHDEKHVRWSQHEAKRRANPRYKNPMKMHPERQDQHAALGEDGVDWLASLPLQLELGNGWHAVHGGAVRSRTLAKQIPAVLLRCRFVDDAGAMISATEPPPSAHLWATMWPGPESIVYGHHVHDLVQPRIDHPAEGVTCVGIDTGCCFGGRLTAYVVESGEVIQVPARRAYAELREVAVE